MRSTDSMRTTHPEEHCGVDILSSAEGWLYTAGGPGSSKALFDDPPAVGDTLLEDWARLLTERHRRLASMDVSYLHLGVPDRLSLHADRLNISRPRPHASPLARMMARVEGAPTAWVDVAGYLKQQIDRHPLHWKTDSRWSPWAGFMTLQLLCGRLGVEANGQVLGYPYQETLDIGDLGQRRIGLPEPSTPEAIRRYRFERRSTEYYRDELGERLALEPDDTVHSLEFWQGARAGYRNTHPNAVPLTLLAFGDEHMAIDTSLFGAMLAETFREVHLVIGDNVDDRLVERLKPDVVISALDERHMYRLADDNIGSAERAASSLSTLRGRAIAEPDARGSEVRISTVLPQEQYRLDPPITAQSACVDDLNDEWMHTRETTLYDVTNARVFFNGPRHLITTHDGRTVSRFDVDEEKERAIHWQLHRGLSGTTLIFATTAGAHCYYHWMLELLPKFGLLERAGISAANIDNVVIKEIVGDWQLQTLARCGIKPEQIVNAVDGQYFECERVLHVDLNAGINLKMHRFIPQWMKHLYPVDARGQERLRLYISRPPGVRRGISNEAAFEPLLKAHGFTSVVMEGLSVAEQAALLARADVVMAAHGGALTNMVFCRPGTHVIELMSRHVYPYYYGLAASCGHIYHAVLESPEQDYPRLVNHGIAQSYAGAEFQHATHSLSFDVPLEPLQTLLEGLGSVSNTSLPVRKAA